MTKEDLKAMAEFTVACVKPQRPHYAVEVAKDYLRLLAQEEARGEVGSCAWHEKDDGSANYWETGCGHTLMLVDGRAPESDVRFCYYCGRSIVIHELAPTERD
jgi:hypothetical protein